MTASARRWLILAALSALAMLSIPAKYGHADAWRAPSEAADVSGELNAVAARADALRAREHRLPVFPSAAPPRSWKALLYDWRTPTKTYVI